MPQLELDDETILVEWMDRPGVEQVGIFDLKNKKNVERSKKALDSAMTAIKKMAHRVKKLNDSIPVEFSQVEVTFGIALDYEVGAILSKASTKAAIDVKLVWDRKAQSKAKTKNARRSSSSKTS
ncbi:MAG TPA: CU044_2847 family protein [Anaerolineales bacterium]|nr:CU044_2847 family protein [Anaerolineales bacterium]